GRPHPGPRPPPGTSGRPRGARARRGRRLRRRRAGPARPLGQRSTPRKFVAYDTFAAAVRTLIVALAILAAAAPSAQAARVGIAIAHPDPAGEDALLAGLFDRSTPDYHRFLTPQRYAQRFGVRPATQSAVRAWLHSAGLQIDHVTGAGDYFLA